MQRILGLDPGLQRTGYAVIEGTGFAVPRIVEAGIIRLPASQSLAKRIALLYSDVCGLIEEHKPQEVAIEELFSHYERPKTAILMGHARGVLFLAAEQAGLPIASYMPTRVKRTMTGSGKASKDQMQLAVKVQFKLDAAPSPPDVADALAIALCHLHGMRLAG